MASIPLPALSVHPQTEAPDLLQNYARLQQLKSLGNQQQLQQQAIQAGAQENRMREMQLEDQQKLRQAFLDSGGDMDEFYKSATKAGVNPQTIIGIKSNILEQKQKLATLSKDQLANYKAQTDALGQATGSVLGLDPKARKPALLNTVLPNLVKQGVIPQDQAEQYANEINNADDASLEQMLKLHQFSAMAADKQIDEAFKAQTRPFELQKTKAEAAGAEADAAQKQRSNAASQLASAGSKEQYAELWGELPAKVARMFPSPEQWTPEAKDAILQGGMTPHEQASVPVDKIEMKDWLSRPENRGKGPADFMRYQKTIVPQFNFNLQTSGGGITPPGTPAADVAKRFGMSPDAFDQAAERFYQTGTLPPIGRGNAASQALNKAIMNRTAELHPNESLAAGSAEYKANAESLKKLQSMADAVGSFENTALKNLDLFIGQAKKVVDSGSPWINKPLRTISEKALGNADLPAYNAARQVAINEIAKVTSNPNLSSVLSDTARKEVEQFNPADATLQQTLRVASVLKQDMANRKSSIEDQIGVIQGRLRGAQKGSGNQGGGNTNGPMKITLPSGKTIEIQ